MGEAVVYFDGVCNLCNRFVDFLIRHDRHRRYRFAPLQGETARRRLPPSLTGATPGTLVLESGGVLRFRSDAVLAIITGLGGFWRAAAALGRLVPRPFRDRLYQYVAKRRFGWFGTRSSCRLPTAEESALFLD